MYPDEVLVPGAWLEKAEEVLAFAEEFIFSDPALDPDFTLDSRRRLYKGLSAAVASLMEYEHGLKVNQPAQTNRKCARCKGTEGEFRVLGWLYYCHETSKWPLLTCYEQEWVARNAR
jgi:hypothetical protein